MPKNSTKVTAGRIGGLTTVARLGGKAMQERATAGFLRRFELEVDPEGVLDPVEREKRAMALRKAHFARLGMKSGAARRKAAAG